MDIPLPRSSGNLDAGLYSLVLTLLIFAVTPAKAQQAQEQLRRNSIFLEVGGNGGFYSLNYDRMLLEAEYWRLAGRAGVMYYSTVSGGREEGRSSWLAVPLEVSWLHGRKSHFLELGLGVTPLYQKYPQEGSVAPESELRLLPVGRLGYRYQQREGGMFYKAGFTPMAQFSKERNLGHSTLLPWFGLAVGYTLRR